MDFETLLASSPGPVKTAVSAMLAMIEEKHFMRAIDLGTQTLKQHPHDACLHTIMAKAYINAFKARNGDTHVRRAIKKAKTELATALRLFPENDKATTLLAGVMMKEKNFARVVELLFPLYERQKRAYLQSNKSPPDEKIFSQLGVALIACKRPQEALIVAEAGLFLYPQNEYLGTLHVNALIDLNRAREAWDLAHVLLHKFPKNKYVERVRGYAQKALNPSMSPKL